MGTADVVDNALELLVVPSFSRWGYEARRRLFDWQEPPAQALAGKTALVTGPTSGLGRSIAGSLADLGARVVLVGRNADKLARVRDELTMATRADRFPTVVADLSSRAAVLAAVDQIRATESRLDVLIDNAGGLYAERRESVDGIELTLALMVVGPFMLVGGLLPLLRAGSGGRVVTVTSGGMYTQPVDLDDLQWRDAQRWSGPRAYARAKRVQVALMREWARRSAGSGVTFNAMHPGWADTPGLTETLPAFRQLMAPILRTPAEGADTAVWLAASGQAAGLTGYLFLDRRARPFDRIPSTRLSLDAASPAVGSGGDAGRRGGLTAALTSPDLAGTSGTYGPMAHNARLNTIGSMSAPTDQAFDVVGVAPEDVLVFEHDDDGFTLLGGRGAVPVGRVRSGSRAANSHSRLAPGKLARRSAMKRPSRSTLPVRITPDLRPRYRSATGTSSFLDRARR